MSDDAPRVSQPLTDERKADLMHRLLRAEGQVRGLQKLLEDAADCTKIAQQLLATRHALDSTTCGSTCRWPNGNWRPGNAKAASARRPWARCWTGCRRGWGGRAEARFC